MAHAESTEPSIEEHWEELVSAALLGTDRRDPPPPVAALHDLVADTARAAPSERMLAQVAACTAVRRAAFLPGPALPALAPPPEDRRPVCPSAAVDRWHHVTTSWPVLEDEWTITLIRERWRVAPELVPQLLRRHRTDAIRRARVRRAAGALADWLVDLLPELAASRRSAEPDPLAVDVLPVLPIPPELHVLLEAPGHETGTELAGGLDSGTFVHAHRGVLVNVVARTRPEALVTIAEHLQLVHTSSPGYATAALLGDLALTRHHMLGELAAEGHE